jgi:hypothetical protein
VGILVSSKGWPCARSDDHNDDLDDKTDGETDDACGLVRVLGSSQGRGEPPAEASSGVFFLWIIFYIFVFLVCSCWP